MSSVRRAIIHVGMPRTGSTSFQHVLSRLRPELSAKGIFYPDLTPNSARHQSHISHQHFGETLDGRRPARERSELLQQLSADLSGCESDVVLLSYEDFIQQKPCFKIPELLNAFFAERGFIAEALVVVKPQSDHLNSIYTHRMQMIRERRDFAHFAPTFERSARFEYDQLIQPWIDAFSGRLRAVPVRDRRSKSPLVRRMFAAIDLNERVAPLLADRNLLRIQNRSPGPVAVEISRRLRTMRTHAQLRVQPRDMMRMVERLVREHGYDQEKFNGIDGDLSAAMKDRYRRVNGRFARTVWGRSWDDIVAPTPISDVNELATRKIDPVTEQVIETVLRIAAQRFEVTPRRSILDQPINLMIEHIEALQRHFGVSQWRVI